MFAGTGKARVSGQRWDSNLAAITNQTLTSLRQADLKTAMSTGLLTAGSLVWPPAILYWPASQERAAPSCHAAGKPERTKSRSGHPKLSTARRPATNLNSETAPPNFWLSPIWCLIQADPTAFLSISTQVFLLMLFPVGGKKCVLNRGGPAQGRRDWWPSTPGSYTCTARGGGGWGGHAGVRECVGKRASVHADPEGMHPLFLELTDSLPTT